MRKSMRRFRFWDPFICLVIASLLLFVMWMVLHGR